MSYSAPGSSRPRRQETVYKGVEQSTTNILLKGSVFGVSDGTSLTGINLTLGLAPGAPTIDLTQMKIVYSTSTINPIVLNWTDQGLAKAAYGMANFTTTAASMSPTDQLNIAFGIPPAASNTVMHIEIRPPGGGAAIPFTLTVPPSIEMVNVLH